MPNVCCTCDCQLFVLRLSVLKMNNEPPSSYYSGFHHQHHRHHNNHHDLSSRPDLVTRIKTSTPLVSRVPLAFHIPPVGIGGATLGFDSICYIIDYSVHSWAGKRTWYSDSGAGRSGDRIHLGARFSSPVQTDTGAQPASCKMGTGSLSRR